MVNNSAIRLEYWKILWNRCDKVKICGRQPLKNLRKYGLLKQILRLFSKNFTWSILEHFVLSESG